jgi:hypothetical protein
MNARALFIQAVLVICGWVALAHGRLTECIIFSTASLVIYALARRERT